MTNFITTITAISIFLYLFGLVSLFIKEKLYISETIFSTLFGFILGDFLFTQIDEKRTFMINISRVVLSLQVVAVGISVPKSYIKKEWRSLLIILAPVMILTFVTSSLIIYILCINVIDFWLCVVIGACVTPTDPVLAAAVLKGKFAQRYIPRHLINLLIVESGANDGLGFILLTIPLAFIRNYGFKEWMYTIFYEILFAILLGGIIGYVARKILYYSKKYKLIDKESFLVSVILLGIFVTGITSLLKSDDILACFVTGMFFSWDDCFMTEIKESHLMEVIDLLFNHFFFIFFGSMVKLQEFKLIYLPVLVLIIFLRRLPYFFVFRRVISQLRSDREVFFAGWYGPIGVGAIFFAYHASHELHGVDILGKEHVLPMVYAIVVGSIFVHGLTAPIVNFHLRKKTSNTSELESSNFTDIGRDSEADMHF